MRRHLIAVISCLPVTVGWAATLYVDPNQGSDSFSGLCPVWDGGTCGPKRSIQGGVDGATDGDVVILSDGYYGEFDVAFHGRRVTVRSGNGPAMCIIDMQHAGRPFFLHEGETANTVIDGITMRHCGVGALHGLQGGAIRISNAGLTVRNCIFEDRKSTRL